MVAARMLPPVDDETEDEPAPDATSAADVDSIVCIAENRKCVGAARPHARARGRPQR